MHSGFTTWWMVLVALLYRLIFMVAGGYLTAMLSPNRPMRHALILGGIGLVVGILGAIASWNIAPVWFSIALILLALPCVWVGVQLTTRYRVALS